MNEIYRLGEFEVDSLRRQIRRNGELVPVPQKPFDVLLYLIVRAGRVVTKEELMEAIWPKAFVEEANLTQSIFLLRKTLSDSASGSRYIVTVPGRGYQLAIAPVELTEMEAAAGANPALNIAPKPAGSASEIPETVPRRNRLRRTGLYAVSVVALAGVFFVGWKLWHGRSGSARTYAIRRLTNSGDVQFTAISLSGTYVASVLKGALGSESISVSDRRTGTSRVILEDDAAVFSDITFSPGDLYLYYRSYSKADPDRVSSEYRVPLLGGNPIMIIRDVDGPITFLADGKRLCFWRGSSNNSFAVMSADAENGKDEKTLARGSRPFPISLACAPDGEIAAMSTEVGGIAILDFKTGQSRPFYQSAQGSEIYGDLSWKADGSELIGFAVTPFNFYFNLFLLSYPQGVRTQITHDIDSYRNPGITADGNMIVARQTASNAQFESFNLPLLAENPEVNSFPWTEFLGWRDEDRILGSTVEGGIKIKQIAEGQEDSNQIANSIHFLQPNGCGAESLVASGSEGSHKEITIWHMHADGSDPKQLTHGSEDILPACTSDGKWVLYADNSFRQRAAIYRVSVDGGASLKIGEGSVWFAVSHKGDRVAWIETEGPKQFLVQAELESGRRLASIPIPPQLKASRSLSFGQDDQHVFLISHGDTSDSIYQMPLDGSAPTKQIEFRAAHIAAMMVSPAGKHLGVVTVKPVSDAVLLQKWISN